jgi:hypothetical protein
MSPRLFSRCSKRVERVRTGSTEELGRTIGVFLAASLTDHMCMPSGRCKSVLILWTVGLFDCHSLTFYFWVDIERTRPRRPSGSVDLYVIRSARGKFKRLRRLRECSSPPDFLQAGLSRTDRRNIAAAERRCARRRVTSRYVHVLPKDGGNGRYCLCLYSPRRAPRSRSSSRGNNIA